MTRTFKGLLIPPTPTPYIYLMDGVQSVMSLLTLCLWPVVHRATGDIMLNGGATPLMASLEYQGEFTRICASLIHNDLAAALWILPSKDLLIKTYLMRSRVNNWSNPFIYINLKRNLELICPLVHGVQSAGWLDLDFTLCSLPGKPLATCREKCCRAAGTASTHCSLLSLINNQI
jgi:hypothetical protein